MTYTEDKLPQGLDTVTSVDDTDFAVIGDTSDSGRAKGITWANLKTTLTTAFNSVYAAVSHTHAASDVISGTFDDARISESSVTQHETNTTITNIVSGTRIATYSNENGVNVDIDVPNASDTQQGIIEIATQAEVDAGTDTSKAVTPDTLSNYPGLGGGGGGGGIDNVVEDTTPQLGGDLDVNGNAITSVSNGNIEIDPNGTGKVLIGTDDDTAMAPYAKFLMSSDDASNSDFGNILHNDSGNPIFFIGRSRGTEASPTTLVDGDPVGGLQATGYDGTNYVSTVFNSLRWTVDGTVSTGTVPMSAELRAQTDIKLIPGASGVVQVNNKRITLVADPTGAQDAATKAYVDAASGGVSDGDKGDITVSGTGTVWTIDDDAVTLDKIQDIATNRVLARSSSGTGSVEDLTLPQFRTLINVENGADVTDTANVTAAGALMDSELTSIADVKALDQSVVSGASPVFTTTNMTDATNKRFMTDAQEAILDATSGTNTGDEVAASDTVAGVVELATVAETNTGTDTARSVTPDALAGSYAGTKTIQATCFNYTADVATGDGAAYFHIPANLNGMNIVSVHAEVITAGTTGTTDIQIHNVTDAVDLLSTKLTIDSGETGSDTAATAAVINTANDDVSTNDLWRVDVDAVSTTAPEGLIVTLELRLP